ncbi:hypothetical protein [Bacillus cereus]|uniref:hypothetical protein n=1 Tax=Bacillus cereus TaxID=1396 RepID=UPI00234B3E11|nr:hypothetical protein [Bacillus cereus]
MAKISGYAIGVGITAADHTYVKSNDGCTWPCFGRSTCGHEICSGSGDSQKCNELAGPDSHAEIKYSITGVCHQAANRILIPTGQTVKEAGYYSLSTSVYGIYGTDANEFFDKHHIKPLDFEIYNNSADEIELIKNVQNLYLFSNEDCNNTDSPIDLLVKEFELSVQYKLNNSVSNALMGGLKKMLKNFHIKKEELANDLNSQKLTPKEYADEINKEILVMLSSFSKKLTTEEFKKIFGLMPGEQINLVDPEIMAKEYK